MPGDVTIDVTQDLLTTRINSSDNWPEVRDAVTGGVSSSPSFSAIAMRATKVISGRTIIYNISRSYFEFDTSSITHVPSTAEFRLYGYTNGNADVACLKGTWGTTPEYASIYGFVLGNSDGAGGGDNSSNVTHYADEVTTWSTSGYNRMLLNAEAKVDMAGNDKFKIAMIEHDRDLRDIAPSDATNYSGCYYEDFFGTLRDPKLIITTQDDSVFFGANF